ncbi:MAG: hypothetical protein MUF18_12370, partial [Fimbriiglobus sp.]|nr:hypothetical protein [Fimbriiglobus sp.]
MTGAFNAGRVRAWLSAAVGVLLAGAATAQPGAVAPSPPSQWGTWPGGQALRQAQAQEPPPVVPQSTPLAA